MMITWWYLEVCKVQLSVIVLLLCIGDHLGQDQYEPLYLGTFANTAHRVAGDIFIIDEKTIYIQDFAHDGQAPDVFFWADGVIIPYITRYYQYLGHFDILLVTIQ